MKDLRPTLTYEERAFLLAETSFWCEGRTSMRSSGFSRLRWLCPKRGINIDASLSSTAFDTTD
jgi:hypothetical protein